MTRFFALTVFAAACIGRPLAGSETVFRTGPHRVALIELFTSEGCSSCPPAENWLAGLRDDPGLWKQFVPVAFHVDYWDRLGWRDALASKAFTAREYAYAEAWRASSVYTPCFVRDGAEWRVDERGENPRVKPDARAAEGTLTLTWQEDGSCSITYLPAESALERSQAMSTAAKVPAAAGFEASIALLGGGIVSKIRAGENSGRELRHEFVALRFATVVLRPNAAGEFQGRVAIAPRTDIGVTRRALAGWITRPGELTPQQAAGGWLP